MNTNAMPYGSKEDLRLDIIKMLTRNLSNRLKPQYFVPSEFVEPLFRTESEMARSFLFLRISEWTTTFNTSVFFDAARNAYRFTFAFSSASVTDSPLASFAALDSTKPDPAKSATEDTVRVLRILEYTGPRSAVEKQIERSVTGTRTWGAYGDDVTLRAVTIGAYPEILSRPAQNQDPTPPQHTVCSQCGHAASIWTGHGWLCVCGQTRIDAQRLESGPTSAEERTK